nr:hypothetical protein [Tanacetum cinerariifolium]
ARTPKQNGVVERRKSTLVKAAEPISNSDNFNDSLANSIEIPLKEDLENLFGPMFDEYFERSSKEVPRVYVASDNSFENDTSPSTSISVDDDSPPLIPSTLEEPSSPEPINYADVSNQEDNIAVDVNEFGNSSSTPLYEEAESSSSALDPSNMHTFYQ